MTSQISNKELECLAPVLSNPDAGSDVLLVCEHASHRMPEAFGHLGLSDDLRQSHIAWDPGALGVAQTLSRGLDARLVEARASRLCYDCNRPPESPDAIPPVSEIFEIPGNSDLSAGARADRVKTFYEPFRALLAQVAKTSPRPPVIVTVHSFTPVYRGAPRAVEIGVVHDEDSRLADAMLACAADHTGANVGRNDPYGPAQGVTHTLKEHALSNGFLNVMLEIRNDLITTAAEQEAMGEMLAGWITSALASDAIQANPEGRTCQE